MRRRLELALFVAGLAAVVYGIWQIHRPSAWITAGLAAAATALISRTGEIGG